VAANVMENQRRRLVNHPVPGNQNICTSKVEAAALVTETLLRPNLPKKREAPAKFTDVVATANKKRTFH
jgi:hypothetical protein